MMIAIASKEENLRSDRSLTPGGARWKFCYCHRMTVSDGGINIPLEVLDD